MVSISGRVYGNGSRRGWRTTCASGRSPPAILARTTFAFSPTERANSAEGYETKEGSMASAKCGGTNIDYDEKLCTYTCMCAPNQACVWSVSCPGPGGKDITTNRTGHLAPPRDPSVVIAGNLAVVAKQLGKVWGRRVVIPAKLRGVRVRRRTLK